MECWRETKSDIRWYCVSIGYGENKPGVTKNVCAPETYCYSDDQTLAQSLGLDTSYGVEHYCENSLKASEEYGNILAAITNYAFTFALLV